MNQDLIIQDIKQKFKKNNKFVGYVYGPPGTGKSMIGILLAKELNGSIVKTFNPSQPGDCIENLYSLIEPTEEKPLIILFDEFDIMIDSIHSGISQHKNIPTQITNKTTWNMFFDDFNLGLYQNIVILLTSNVSPDDFKIKYDPSYIREGRVNNIYVLK
jgi:ATP-dependent 26S proteasome regulatory subunit